MVRIKTKNRK